MENQPHQLSAHVSVPGSVDMTFQLSAEVAEMIITGDKHLRSVAMRLCSHRHSVLTRNQSHLLNVNGINTVTKLKPNGYFTSNAMISSPALMLVWASSIKTHNTTSTSLVYDLMWFNKTDEKGWFSIWFQRWQNTFHVQTDDLFMLTQVALATPTPTPLLLSFSPYLLPGYLSYLNHSSRQTNTTWNAKALALRQLLPHPSPHKASHK